MVVDAARVVEVEDAALVVDAASVVVTDVCIPASEAALVVLAAFVVELEMDVLAAVVSELKKLQPKDNVHWHPSKNYQRG